MLAGRSEGFLIDPKIHRYSSALKTNIWRVDKKMVLSEFLEQSTQEKGEHDRSYILKGMGEYFRSHGHRDLLRSEISVLTVDSLRKAVEDFIRSICFSKRLYASKSVNNFFKTLPQIGDIKVCRTDKAFRGPELDILLLKHMQGGKNSTHIVATQQQYADEFDMTLQAMQKRINDMQNGKEILGHQVMIETGGRGHASYDDTVHPVFLALNLSEVYLLTVALKKAFGETEFEDDAGCIANDIYQQLSEYAKVRISRQGETIGIAFKEGDPYLPIGYRCEEENAIYFLKSGERCRLTIGDQCFRGRIIMDDWTFSMLTDNGEKIALPEDRAKYSLTWDRIN